MGGEVNEKRQNPNISRGRLSPHGAIGEKPLARSSLTSDLDLWLYSLSLRDSTSATVSTAAGAAASTAASTIVRPATVASTMDRPATVTGTMDSPATVASTIDRPATVASTIDRPANMASTDDDPAFKNDLSHVLVWFNEDLTSQQRFFTTYTLMQHLESWQIDVLLKLLPARKADKGSDQVSAQAPVQAPDQASVEAPDQVSVEAPSPLKSWQPVYTPEPQRPLALVSEWSVDEISLAQSDVFFRDVSAWLRLHRLHKYQNSLKGYSANELLEFDDEKLYKIGVTALGARRKFLRLFQLFSQEEK